MWRAYYKQRAVHDLRATTVVKQPAAPTRPDEGEDPIEEPEDLEGFFASMRSNFRMAATNFRDELINFRIVPK